VEELIPSESLFQMFGAFTKVSADDGEAA